MGSGAFRCHLTEIIADKISAISSRAILRRAKDLVDVFALAHCVAVSSADIAESHRRNGRILGDFTEFRTRVTDVAHAYDRLRGVINKPDFHELHQYLARFLDPFISKQMADKLWSPKRSGWGKIRETMRLPDDSQKLGLLEKIRLGQEKVARQDTKRMGQMKSSDKFGDDPEI